MAAQSRASRQVSEILNRPAHFPAPVGILGRRAGQVLLGRFLGHIFLVDQPQHARASDARNPMIA